mmetsp:Transcript_17350/g.28497  ORF Transcript_17350/g.28497 Transcript_17350/m.28497 type:complete len:84 (-) Transcript_17350:612-863(-)
MLCLFNFLFGPRSSTDLGFSFLPTLLCSVLSKSSGVRLIGFVSFAPLPAPHILFVGQSDNLYVHGLSDEEQHLLRMLCCFVME